MLQSLRDNRCYNLCRSHFTRLPSAALESIAPKEPLVMASSPLTLDDYWNLRFLTDMRLSPDGRFIAYVAQSADREANEIRSAIWLLDVRSGETRQLTSGEKRDSSPRWSPDGRGLA